MPSEATVLKPLLSASLMAYDVDAAQRGFIGPQVLPVYEAESQNGSARKFDVKAMLGALIDKPRGEGGGYDRATYEIDTFEFSTKDYGAEEPIDDRSAARFASQFDSELVATKRARDRVLRSAEKRIADAVFNTTTFTGSTLYTDVSGVSWATIASSLPVTDVDAARVKVYNNSGLIANTVIMGWERFLSVRNSAQILDRCKYWGGDDPLAIGAPELARAFGLPPGGRVLIAGAQYNSANPGQTASLGKVWPSSYCMVCYTANPGDPLEDPCLGRMFHWGEDGSQIGGLVESYREEAKRSTIIRCRHDVVEKIMYTAAGHLLKVA